MTDPTAALAEALPGPVSRHGQRIKWEYMTEQERAIQMGDAAAILADLPPDWCGHEAEIADLVTERNGLGDSWQEARAEIARLRPIEEAARAYRRARDIRREWAESHGYIVNSEFDALRDAESEADAVLRAALEADSP